MEPTYGVIRLDCWDTSSANINICQERFVFFYCFIAYLFFLVFSICILLASERNNEQYFLTFYISMLSLNLREGEILSFIK